jgi:preprotein translocase subunit SecE
MASKREKQSERSLVQEDQRQKRSNNQAPGRASRTVEPAEKRGSAVKGAQKRGSAVKGAEKRGSAVEPAEKRGSAVEPAEKRGSAVKRAEKRNAQSRRQTETGSESAPPASMNREMKRMMKRREGAADRLRRPTVPPKGKRTKPLAFIKEVRGELARVAWPTRQEVITYTLVVIVTVAFFMIVIGAIDFVALKGVLFLIGQKGN